MPFAMPVTSFSPTSRCIPALRSAARAPSTSRALAIISDRTIATV